MEKSAERISEAREWFDEHVKGESRQECDIDRAANEFGRRGAKSGKSCRDVCDPFRPAGLPPQY